MTRVRGRAVMRDHSVHERASTPLELFFDLCFVVAVAFLAVELHHGIAEQHTVSALVWITSCSRPSPNGIRASTIGVTAAICAASLARTACACIHNARSNAIATGAG